MEGEEFRAVATVEEIQKRLIRPTNSHSLPNFFTSSQNQYNTIGQNSSHKLRKIGEDDSRKLEEFLDPVLLSAVRAKICGKKRKNYEEEKTKSGSYSSEFDKFEQLRMRKSKFVSDEAVDLSNHGDSISIGDGEIGRVLCSPFMQFESTTYKRFKQ